MTSNSIVTERDLYYLRVAKVVSERSKDPSTKVGAVIVAPTGELVSTGYNGFPRGFPDLPEHYANRDTKLAFTIHAEMNALIFARRDLAGATMYTWPLMPCDVCARHLVQAGVTRFVSPHSDVERWQASFAIARKIIALGKRELVEAKLSTLPPNLASSLAA